MSSPDKQVGLGVLHVVRMAVSHVAKPTPWLPARRAPGPSSGACVAPRATREARALIYLIEHFKK